MPAKAKRLGAVIGVVGGLGGLEIASRVIASPMLTPPSSGALAWWGLIVSGELVGHTLATLQTVLLGFAISVIGGCSVGIALYTWSWVRAVLLPVTDTVRHVPSLALFPPIILFLGLGVAGQTAVIVWNAWPAMLIATLQALRTADRYVIEASWLDGASKWQSLRHIHLPLATPQIVAGMRISLGTSFVAVVAAEMLGSNQGLGWAVLAYSQTFHYPEMYAAIGHIALVGFVLTAILNKAQEIVNEFVS